MSEQTAATQVRQPAKPVAPTGHGAVLQRACACGKHAGNGGECAECRKKRLGLQRRAVGRGPETAPPIVHEVLRSPGRPLDDQTRGFMESRFGHDFSRVPATAPSLATAGLVVGPVDDPFERQAERQSRQVMSAPAVPAGAGTTTVPDFSRVRVHTDSRASESARAVNALAYTIGDHVVFDAGRYAPGTSAGRSLLAHELTHVMQQGGATTHPSLFTIQRQPAPPTLSADPGGGIAAQGYAEVRDRPSIRIRIIAHASPRWRSASSHPTADLRNLKLSEQRSNAVHNVVNEVLQQLPGMWTTVNVDDADDNLAGTSGTKTEFRGSRDTLKEAKGNRSDDALQRRRVDVVVKSSRRVSGHAQATGPVIMVPTASMFWHVSFDFSAGATAGLSGKALLLKLTNDRSDQSMEGWVLGGGIGLKAPIGVSISPWSDPVGFHTDHPLNFEDFNNVKVRYTNFGLSFFIGYEWAYASFVGLGSGAQSVDVSGGTVGTPGLGGDVVAGNLWLVGPYPPTQIPIKDSDKLAVPYQRAETGEFVHTVTFSTESATLSELELEMLQVFLKNVITD